MYGGGVRAGHPDPETPFRAASIRGHLRFWWRATRGNQFTDWEALRQREGEIWGSTDRVSPVRVSVVCTERPRKRKLLDFKNDLNRRYALFAAYESRENELTDELIQEGGAFEVTLTLRPGFEHLQADINAALWAWLNFGGLGARTRRGAGALYCADYAYWAPDHIVGDSELRPWPSLRGAALVWGKQKMNWHDCWSEVLSFYREFRQDREGRGPTSWPEPDEIRSMTGMSVESPGEGFPRGALGLPIVFHFKDRWDPPDHTLSVKANQPHDSRQGRMNSPVIIRPWAVSAREAIPLLLVLKAPQPDQLYLFAKGEEPRAVDAGVRDGLAELIRRAQKRWNAEAIRL